MNPPPTTTIDATATSLSSAELARLTLLTPQTINAIVRNLEDRRAIRRSPHQVHGRILSVELIDEGCRLLALCRTRADRIEARLEEGLATDAERKAVRRWLSYVATPFLGQSRAASCFAPDAKEKVTAIGIRRLEAADETAWREWARLGLASALRTQQIACSCGCGSGQ